MTDHDEGKLELGALLHLAIKEAKISRAYLAEKLYCSIDTIDNWCSGRVTIKPSNIEKLCLLLNDLNVSHDVIGKIYQINAECFGFHASWHPDKLTKKQITWCISGSLVYRKELHLLHNIADRFSDRDRTTLIFDCNDRMQTLLSCIDVAISTGVSNLVVCGMSMPDDVYRLVLDKMRGYKALVIFVLTDCSKEIIDEYPNAYAVTWSIFDLACRATNVLISSGHKNIGTIYIEKHAERFAGYLQALKEAGIRPQTNLVLDGGKLSGYSLISDSSFMEKLNQFITNVNEKMTAIFAPTELLSMAIPIQLAQSRKMHNRKMAVSGLAYPGWIGQELQLPITYIQYPIEEVTECVLDILLRRVIANDKTSDNNTRYFDLTNKAIEVTLKDNLKLKSLRSSLQNV